MAAVLLRCTLRSAPTGPCARPSRAAFALLPKQRRGCSTAATISDPPRAVSHFEPRGCIEDNWTPPAGWYTSKEVFEKERRHVFGVPERRAVNSRASQAQAHLQKRWVAVDVLRVKAPREYQSGVFMQQPYIIMMNDKGDVNAFYNVCTHAGSCVVPPVEKYRWRPMFPSEKEGKREEESGELYECTDAKRDVESIPFTGSVSLKRCAEKSGFMQCPYHGWRFNFDGRLVRATDIRGIQNFKSRDYGLQRINVIVRGGIVFLDFGPAEEITRGQKVRTEFQHADLDEFERLLSEFGYAEDFSDLEYVATKEYPLNCNWKVFIDNYNDGCYHCSYAHPGLSANINEAAYSTALFGDESGSSCQLAPPNEGGTTARFGEKTACYACIYPNIMYNRYGPWLDVNLVKPIDEERCVVQISWFLASDFEDPEGGDRRDFIKRSLESSGVVQTEDVFLCENVQIGLQGGFAQGRYIPSKQQAAFVFHKCLAREISA